MVLVHIAVLSSKDFTQSSTPIDLTLTKMMLAVVFFECAIFAFEVFAAVTVVVALSHVETSGTVLTRVWSTLVRANLTSADARKTF